MLTLGQKSYYFVLVFCGLKHCPAEITKLGILSFLQMKQMFLSFLLIIFWILTPIKWQQYLAIKDNHPPNNHRVVFLSSTGECTFQFPTNIRFPSFRHWIIRWENSPYYTWYRDINSFKSVYYWDFRRHFFPTMFSQVLCVFILRPLRHWNRDFFLFVFKTYFVLITIF